MKKVISTLIAIISIFSFAITYNIVDINQSNNIKTIEEDIAKPFEIPESLILADYNKLYSTILSVAQKMNVNIFKNNIIVNKEGEFETIKHVLFTTQTNFYDVFSINGELINSKNMIYDNFISTKHTNKKQQIGFIKDFGNNDNITIKSLKYLNSNFSTDGMYYVELKSNAEFSEFIKELTNQINTNFNSMFENEDFISTSKNNESYLKLANPYLKAINLRVLIICTVLIFYFILKSSKEISIYMLNGISRLKTWDILIQRYINSSFILITIVLIIVSIIVKLPIEFYYNILKIQLIYYTFITIGCFITYFIVTKFNIGYNLKSKENDLVLIIFNIAIKFFMTIYIISTGIVILNGYNNLNSSLKILENWEKGKNYGIFYPILKGNDTTEELSLKSEVTTCNNLYSIINKKGALLIDTMVYEEDVIEYNSNYNGYDSVLVNPNYLKEFHIYDTSNNIIDISENEKDWVILVPEKYKNEEDKILEFFTNLRSLAFDYEINSFSGQVPKDVRNQKIKLIWTKSNQDIFSFNPKVYKDQNNTIKDIIIEVVTENNSIASDRQGIIGMKNSDPIKVKLINNSPEETYKDLEPELKKLNLDDNLTSIVSSNEIILNEIHTIEEGIKISIITILILAICYFVIVVQNIIIIFNKKKKTFIVRRLFGMSFFKCYNEFIYLLLLSWIAQFITLTFMYKGISIELIVISSMFMVIELILSTIALIVIENKNKVNVLKGE